MDTWFNSHREFLQLVLEGLGETVCIVNHSGVVIFATEQWLQSLKACCPPERYLTESQDYLSSFRRIFSVTVEDMLHVNALIIKVAEGIKDVGRVIVRSLTDDGERFTEVQVRPLKSQLTGLFLLEHSDRTLEIEAQRGVAQKSRELEIMALVAQGTDNAVVITDASGAIEWVNPGFERISGYTLADIQGQRPGSFLQGPETDKQVIKFMSKRISSGQGFNVEILNYHKNGTPYWIDIEVRPIKSADGSVEKFVAIQSDITERKKYSRELQREIDRRANILESACVVEWEYDVKSKVLFLSDKWWDTLGIKLSNMARESLLMGNEKQRESFSDILRDFSLGKEEVFEHLISFTDFSGSSRYVLARGQRSQSLPPTVSGILLDVTEQKELELQISRMSRLEAIGQLSAGIAHEINTPMQYLGDNLKFLEKAFERTLRYTGLVESLLKEYCASGPATWSSIEAKLDQDKIQSAFRRVKERVPLAIKDSLEGVSAVSKIVAAMKDHSHFHSNQKVATDVNAVIESALVVSQNEWKYHARIERELDPALPLVPSFPGELNQVFLNLFVNAAHAIEDANRGNKGVIKLTTSYDDEKVIIAVSDTGAGIEPNVIDKIFDPFFTTKQIGKGTGQGLAITHSIIVGRHKGQIHVSSTKGQGSTFYISIPRDVRHTIETRSMSSTAMRREL